MQLQLPTRKELGNKKKMKKVREEPYSQSEIFTGNLATRFPQNVLAQEKILVGIKQNHKLIEQVGPKKVNSSD